MRPDDARLQDARAWLSKAELDLKAAAHEMAAPGGGLWGDIMFHAQQAAEKSMKAFLAWNDVPFRKTHNLEELGQQCVSLDAMLAPVADQAAPLTEMRGSSATRARLPTPIAPTRRPRWLRRGTCTMRSSTECRRRRDHERAAGPAASPCPIDCRQAR